MLSLEGKKTSPLARTINKELKFFVLWTTDVFHVSRKFRKVKLISWEEPGKPALRSVPFLAMFDTELSRNNS